MSNAHAIGNRFDTSWMPNANTKRNPEDSLRKIELEAHKAQANCRKLHVPNTFMNDTLYTYLFESKSVPFAICERQTLSRRFSDSQFVHENSQ